jgi:hypothetical protein
MMNRWDVSNEEKKRINSNLPQYFQASGKIFEVGNSFNKSLRYKDVSQVLSKNNKGELLQPWLNPKNAQFYTRC